MQGRLNLLGSFSINHKYLEFERMVEMGTLKLDNVICIFSECCNYKICNMNEKSGRNGIVSLAWV